jgi:hypothetical protein
MVFQRSPTRYLCPIARGIHGKRGCGHANCIVDIRELESEDIAVGVAFPKLITRFCAHQAVLSRQPAAEQPGQRFEANLGVAIVCRYSVEQELRQGPCGAHLNEVAARVSLYGSVPIIGRAF